MYLHSYNKKIHEKCIKTKSMFWTKIIYANYQLLNSSKSKNVWRHLNILFMNFIHDHNVFLCFREYCQLTNWQALMRDTIMHSIFGIMMENAFCAGKGVTNLLGHTSFNLTVNSFLFTIGILFCNTWHKCYLLDFILLKNNRYKHIVQYCRTLRIL